MKVIIFFMAIIFVTSCKRENVVTFKNCVDCPEITSGYDGSKNFINFRYSNYDSLNFIIEVIDSSYIIEYNGEMLTFLEFKNKSFKTHVLESQLDGSFILTERKCTKINFDCNDSKYTNLSMFIIEGFLKTEDFGSLNIVLICDYKEGILSTFLTSDSFKSIPNERYKPKINAIRGYTPDCINVNDYFQKVKFI